MTSRVESTERRRAELIEDVEELIAAKEWPERMAHRLGFPSTHSLHRKLQRLGRHDLANRMQQLDRASHAFHAAHKVPMDELMARDRARLERKKAAA